MIPAESSQARRWGEKGRQKKRQEAGETLKDKAETQMDSHGEVEMHAE